MDPVKGEGTVSIGWPIRIHFSKLKQMSAPTTMNDADLEALMADIRTFSSPQFTQP